MKVRSLRGTASESTLTIPAGNNLREPSCPGRRVVATEGMVQEGWLGVLLGQERGRLSSAVRQSDVTCFGREEEEWRAVCWGLMLQCWVPKHSVHTCLFYSLVLEFCSWQRRRGSNFYTPLFFQSGGWGKRATWQIFIWFLNFLCLQFGPASILRYLLQTSEKIPQFVDLPRFIPNNMNFFMFDSDLRGKGYIVCMNNRPKESFLRIQFPKEDVFVSQGYCYKLQVGDLKQ